MEFLPGLLVTMVTGYRTFQTKQMKMLIQTKAIHPSPCLTFSYISHAISAFIVILVNFSDGILYVLLTLVM